MLRLLLIPVGQKLNERGGLCHDYPFLTDVEEAL
jgi:hypothetical protein